MKKLTKEEYELCNQIVDRAIGMGLYQSKDRLTCMLDIENAAKYFNMRLNDWLNADNFDFSHDVCGIAVSINRTAYPVDFSEDPLFLPRFAGEDE